MLRVRNLSDGVRDLVVMFTEDPADTAQLSLEGVRFESPGSGGGGKMWGDTDADGEDGGAARGVSPPVSQG